MNQEVVEFKCTDCGSTVPADAKACPNCGASFEQTAQPDEVDYTCSECGEIIELQAKACPKCGAILYVQYYSVSIGKLALLSICSIGIYQLYWFYKNWVLIKEQERKKILPVVRAIFSLIFCHQLFKRILVSAQSVGYKQKYSPWILTIAYIIIPFLYKLANPLWVFSLFSFVPLLTVQRAVNFNNSKVAPDLVENSHLSAGETILVVVGGLIVGLMVVWTFSTA